MSESKDESDKRIISNESEMNHSESGDNKQSVPTKISLIDTSSNKEKSNAVESTIGADCSDGDQSVPDERSSLSDQQDMDMTDVEDVHTEEGTKTVYSADAWRGTNILVKI